MTDFGWQAGLLLVLFFAVFVPWLVAQVISFGAGDDCDHVADYKRRLENNARRQRWGGRVK